jgi:hypothetical protein
MTDWGNVSGSRIVSGSISIPLSGAWVADVALALPVTLPPKVSLTIGNLTMQGAVYRQASFAGVREARIVAGAGGWSRSVQARAYQSVAGILRSTVLRDAALEVGELVNVLADQILGNYFVRLADKAGRVLRTIGGPMWWIAPNGVTTIGPRTATTIMSPFTAEQYSGAYGTLTIATEDPGAWLPGATFSGPTVGTQTVSSIRHSLGADGQARMEVMVR